MSYIQSFLNIFERFLYDGFMDYPSYEDSESESESELDTPLQTDSEPEPEPESEIIDIQNTSSDNTVITSISSMGIQKRLHHKVCDNV